MAEVTVIVVAGTSGIGKTNATVKELIHYCKNLGRKGIIYDPNNEYGQYILDRFLPGTTIDDPKAQKLQIDTLPHDKIGAFSVQKRNEIRRIIPYDAHGRKMATEDCEALLIRIVNEFTNGAIMIDDLNVTFDEDYIPGKFIKSLTNNRHRNADIIMQTQDLGRLLPKIWQNTKWVRMFKMSEGVAALKGDKLKGENYTVFKIAENIVEEQYNLGNERYSIEVDKLRRKIHGNYTPRMLLSAIETYLDTEATEKIKAYEKFKDAAGKSIYNYTEARQKAKSELFLRYYPKVKRAA